MNNLRTLGFDATNDIFAQNAWYFRNALVRANYNDLKNGVYETTEYLVLFLRNLFPRGSNTPAALLRYKLAAGSLTF